MATAEFSKFAGMLSAALSQHHLLGFEIAQQIDGETVETVRDYALISHASKVMLKIFQARLQQYTNHELPDVQAGFRKGRGTRNQIAKISWIMEKTKSSRKTSISALLTMPKPLTVWITINCGKF